MLTAKEPRFEVLKRVEPTAETDEVISSLLGKMANLMRLLHMPLGKHVEGQCDHQAIPHRGIVRYAFWPLLPRKLYIAVAQDGPSAPLELILGASDFSFVRPVPQIAKLVIPAETSKAKKSVTKMSFDAVSRAVKLLTKSEPAFVTLRFVEFEDDGDAHDEGLIDDRHTEFAASFRMAVESLSRKFGPPARRERGELEVIPIGGVMEYSLWEVEGRGVYVAWCHEDRELPIMLVLGTLPEK